MRFLSIVVTAVFAVAASCGTAHAQATPTGQKSDSQIEQAGSASQTAKKPAKRTTKKVKGGASSSR